MPFNIGPVESITRDMLIKYINDPYAYVEWMGSDDTSRHIHIKSVDDIDTYVTVGDKIRVSEGRYGHLYIFTMD
jgi:hypothetical protein